MATIKIKKLKTPVILGTKPQERLKKQDIFFDIIFEYDTQQASCQDDISQAVDYEQVATNIINSISTSTFFLLEALTAFVLKTVLQDPKITKATVIGYKAKAIKNAKYVSVELSKSRA